MWRAAAHARIRRFRCVRCHSCARKESFPYSMAPPVRSAVWKRVFISAVSERLRASSGDDFRRERSGGDGAAAATVAAATIHSGAAAAASDVEIADELYRLTAPLEQVIGGSTLTTTPVSGMYHVWQPLLLMWMCATKRWWRSFSY